MFKTKNVDENKLMDGKLDKYSLYTLDRHV